MIRPGPRLIRAAAALTAAAPVLIFVPELVWALVLGLGAIAIFSAIEIAELRRIGIQGHRNEAFVLSLGEDEALPIELSSNSRRRIHVEVRQEWPALFADASVVLRGQIDPGEVLALEFRSRTISRGSAIMPAPVVAMALRGWFERIVTAGEPVQTSVIPNLRAVGRFHARLNHFIRRGMGSRTAPRMGKGREFERMRDYVAGDEFRDIAWKASARHDRLIVREFRIDRSQDVLLCIDRGHRMAALVRQLTRLDHALNASLLLAYASNRIEDRTGLLTFAEEVDRGVAPGRGPAHLRSLTAYATGLEPAFRHTDYIGLASHLRRRLSRRTLVLMMTVLPEEERAHELLTAVRLLSPRHLVMVLVLVDPELKAIAAIEPGDKRELCRTLVARDVWNARSRLVGQLRHHGAIVVETAPGDAGVAAINSYLDIKQRQIL